MTRTAGATEHLIPRFDAVSDNAAPAVRAMRRKLMNGTLEAVEHMGAPLCPNFKTLVVVVSTHFALSHSVPRPVWTATPMPHVRPRWRWRLDEAPTPRPQPHGQRSAAATTRR